MLLYFIDSSQTDFQWSGVQKSIVVKHLLEMKLQVPKFLVELIFQMIQETLKIYETVFIQC